MTKQVNELSLERARALLGTKEINDKQLKKMMERIKAFCKVSYQLYLKSTNAEMPDAKIIQLEAEPPNEFTKAA